MTTAGLVVEIDDGTNWVEIGEYDLAPLNAARQGMPWTQIVVDPAVSDVVPNSRPVRVTATFGWTAVPRAITLACLLQASRLYARRHAPFGLVGNPDVAEQRLLAKLDPDVETSARAYRRSWGAV